MESTFTGESVEARAQPWQPAVSVEFVAYLALAVLALTLRLAELDSVPLNAAEAHEALAAWRVVVPGVVGEPVIARSPLLFLLHSLSFMLLGGSELSVRLLTALAGTALVLSPLLFRDLLGRGRTFVLAILLSCSPVLLTASRYDSAVVWTALLAVLSLWAAWRYWHLALTPGAPEAHGGSVAAQAQGVAQSPARGILAVVLAVSAVLLTEPGGYLLVLMLLGAGALALWFGAPEIQIDTDRSRRAQHVASLQAGSILVNDEEMDDTVLSAVRRRLQGFPWGWGAALAALTVILVSTGFLLYRPGLTAVSELVNAGLGGWANARPGGPFLPLLVSLFYEPVLWLFAIASVVLLVRQGSMTLVERFLMAWAALGVAVSIFYSGAGPEHALWLTLPLAALSLSAIRAMLTDDSVYLDEDSFLEIEVPWWAKWVIALVIAAILFGYYIQQAAMGSAQLAVPVGVNFLDTQRNVLFNLTAVFFLTGLMLATGWLATSSWGAPTRLRGFGLGFLAFGLLFGLSSGWQVAVTHAGDPAELWHTQTTDPETFLLRDTLLELSRRESFGFPRIPVSVLAEQDGIVAWLLRDFTQARFIADVGEARGTEIALLPEIGEPPELGGDYVGQRFVISRAWDGRTMYPLDFLTWWLQRRTRVQPVPEEVMVLWLRQDIYNGSPFAGTEGAG